MIFRRLPLFAHNRNQEEVSILLWQKKKNQSEMRCWFQSLVEDYCKCVMEVLDALR